MCPKGTSPYSFSGDGIETINPTVGRGLDSQGISIYKYISIIYHINIYHINMYIYIYTLQKINIDPENDGLEDAFPFQTGDFQVPC